MAPFKTYSRSNETNRMKHGISNDLFAPAFKKRKHHPRKIVIPDLPPATTACQLSDNSLRVTTEDSFDRLLKTCNYNSVHFKSKAGSFSDSSCNIERHRSLRITRPIINVKNYKHSPLTKRRDKITKKNETTYGLFNKEKSSGTSIESSLEIEVLRKAKPLVDSSLGLTDVSVDLHKTINNSTKFEPALCKSFWNNLAICSTPIEPEKQKIIDHTISPIAINNSVNSLVPFKDVSNVRAVVTPTAKAKHDKLNGKENRGIDESVNVGISGRRSNLTVSYITTSKRQLCFTPISSLVKHKSRRLRKGSRDSKDDNKESSNSEKNSEVIEINSIRKNSSHLNLEQSQSKSKYIHGKNPTFHLLKNGETPDVTEISLDDLHMSERASLQESVSVVDKTEPQIERQVNPIYVTLRNRKVLSSNSKKSRRALTFNRSSTSYEGQNPAGNNHEKLNGSDEDNKSSSVFSSESSYNSRCSNKTDIMSTANRRVSYITTRKQKIYFTPISSLVKHKSRRLRKDSRALMDDNEESSNSEQNSEVIEINSIRKNSSPLNLEQSQSKSKHIHGKNPTFHLLKNVETPDVTEISLDDLHMSERASLQESVVDKTEPQIERQVNPIYVTLRNRKVFSGNSKKTRRALTFNRSSTSYEGQNSARNNDENLNGGDGENKSALFSRESSYNSSCSNKTDIISTASKIQQIKNPLICYEHANLEESRNGSNQQAQNVRFEGVSLSIESVNTTASINFYEDACNVKSNAQNAFSAIELEKINPEHLAYDNSDIREDTQDLGSKMNEMIETEFSSLKHNISCVSGRNTSGSAIGENENIDERSKKIAQENSSNHEPSDSESNLQCLSPFSTGQSCNNLESNFSADKTSQIQLKGLENITINSIRRPLEVIINIRRSNTIEVKIKPLIGNNCNLEDLKNTKTDVNDSFYSINVSSDAQQSPSSECTAFAAVLEENNEENTVTSKSEPVIKIKRSNTMEDMIKSSNTNNSNLEGNGHCFDNESQRLTTSVLELEESSEYSPLMNSGVTPTAKSVNEIGESGTTENNSEENLVNSFHGFNLDEENQQVPSTGLSPFIAELRESCGCATRTNSTVSAHVKTNLEPVVKIRRSNTVEEMLKTLSHIENQASKRQNETSKLNEQTGDFHCSSVRQCLEAKPLNCAAHHDFQINDSSNNHSTDSQRDFSFALPHIPTLQLKPGKSYRRSLQQIRNSTCHSSPFKSSLFPLKEGTTCIRSTTGGICTCAVCKRQSLEHLSSPRRVSVRFMPVSSPTSEKASSLQNYAADLRKGYNSNAFQESLLENYFENLSLTRENLEVTLEEPCRESTVTARDIVLRRCGQTEPLPFEKCYTNTLLQHCHKIGEGVYGEVFLFRNQNGGTTVMKIIPIEGDQIINGEKQKKFDEIISEVIIAMELGNLRNGKKNTTAGFNELQKICCIQGKYPERLLELWELYEEGHGTENDSPEIFTKDQLYIVLELANGGKDLESFVFNNAQQAYSIFVQTACAIAVAETALQFEHRDLHWGNVLISNCDRSKKKVRCCINGEDLDLPTYGVEVAIIDFTLSRITHDGVCIYNDLSLDSDLFTATGDYQFDIYRLMRNSNG